MPPVVEKFLPQTIVLIVAVYWAWPALTTPAPKAVEIFADQKKAAVREEFSAAVLSPKFPPPSKRDPFLLPGQQRLVKKKAVKPGAKTQIGKTMDFRDFGLTLSATSIVGEHRLALINGRIYREKESVEKTPGESTGCVITHIEPHRVSVSWNGQSHELTYTDAGKKTANPATNANGNPRSK